MDPSNLDRLIQELDRLVNKDRCSLTAADADLLQEVLETLRDLRTRIDDLTRTERLQRWADICGRLLCLSLREDVFNAIRNWL
jgi:hypothetical protein